jgi:DNA primase
VGQFSGQSDIDRVRDATDLVRLIGEHVPLKPRGREHVGLCPFHDDHSPSMAVVTHKGNAFYKCHACGAGGDAFDFVQNYHKMDFAEALRFLADRAGITLTPRPSPGQRSASGEADEHDGRTVARSSIREANAFAAAFFRKVLQHPEAGSVGRELIDKRGISAEMAEQFMLGYAPDSWDKLLATITRKGMSVEPFAAAGLLKPRKTGDGFYDAFRHRLIFPITSEVGQPIAFGARAIKADDEPKYLNSAESSVFQKSRTLYGLHQAKRSIIDSRTAVITEGYTDVIACHQAGFTNVVGTLGTALTREHARLSRLWSHT